MPPSGIPDARHAQSATLVCCGKDPGQPPPLRQLPV